MPRRISKGADELAGNLEAPHALYPDAKSLHGRPILLLDISWQKGCGYAPANMTPALFSWDCHWDCESQKQ